MSVATATELSPQSRSSLDGVPWVDVAGNLRAAMFAGKRFSSMMREALALRFGPGRLSIAEYFYYRLWDSPLPLEEKRRFVGKALQHAMHLACNDHAWYGVTQDKLLFHMVVSSAGLPVPELLAVVHPERSVPTGVQRLHDPNAVAKLLRDPNSYPFFAKPIDGIYSLGAMSANSIDKDGWVALDDGADQPLQEVAVELAWHKAGMLIQRRLAPAARLASQFGPQLCSVRLLVLLTKGGPHIARAVCKLPAPGNIADNFWRPGNIVAAVDIETGVIERAIRGTGLDMKVNPDHPKTGLRIHGTEMPDWSAVLDLAKVASNLFPAVKTQSWDIALTADGPLLLEMNWGGDVNLAQLAHGRGVLDDAYASHLELNGYDPRRTAARLEQLRAGLRRE
jgi:hypothetical protein